MCRQPARYVQERELFDRLDTILSQAKMEEQKGDNQGGGESRRPPHRCVSRGNVCRLICSSDLIRQAVEGLQPSATSGRESTSHLHSELDRSSHAMIFQWKAPLRG